MFLLCKKKVKSTFKYFGVLLFGLILTACSSGGGGGGGGSSTCVTDSGILDNCTIE